MIDARNFRDTLGRLPTGVCIITTQNEAGISDGVTVGSFGSLSLDPPLVLWSLDRKANCHQAFRAAKSFAVNVLSEDQTDLSRVFAMKEARPWSELTHKPAPKTGAPIFENCCAYIECEMEAIHEGGDHDLFIGRVVRLEAAASGRPLVYFGGSYRRLDDERAD